MDARRKAGEVCRQLGVNEPTFYAWKRKYAGVGVPEVRELRQLREENRNLKQLVADLTLDKHILQEVPVAEVPDVFSHPFPSGTNCRIDRARNSLPYLIL